MPKEQKVIICRGLPGSGKSTWAKDFIEKNPGWVRVNRDTLREMIGGRFSRERESVVKQTRDLTIITALTAGLSVIIDDCNLDEPTLTAHRKLVTKCGPRASVEEKFFATSLDECLKRNALRQNPVPDTVIVNMHERYLRRDVCPEYREQDGTLPKAILVDLDGTLALKGDRGMYDYDKVGTDRPHKPIVNLVKLLQGKYTIIAVSGRMHSCWRETWDWMVAQEINLHLLLMREDGDTRKDSIVKQELYEANIEGKWFVEFVLDDRNSVVNMWRRTLRLPCLQVWWGDF